MSVDTTGDSLVVARPIGSFSLAGRQPKVSAHEVAELQITCDACGWSVRGFLDGNALVECPPGQTPETAARLAEIAARSCG